MKRSPMVLVAVMALMLCLTLKSGGAVSQSASPFSADFFPILPWGTYPNWIKGKEAPSKEGLASIKECGFTIAGFVRPSDLKECERLGLKAIVIPERGGLSWLRDCKTLGDATIEERIRALIAAAGDSSAVLGYYIIDEPGADLFPALGKAVAAVRKSAPGKLAYINLYPRLRHDRGQGIARSSRRPVTRNTWSASSPRSSRS